MRFAVERILRHLGLPADLAEPGPRDLVGCPNDKSVSRLKQLCVTHIVVHADLYPPDEWVKVDERLAQFDKDLMLE